MHGPEPLTRSHPGPTRQLFRGSICGEFRPFAVVPFALDRYAVQSVAGAVVGIALKGVMSDLIRGIGRYRYDGLSGLGIQPNVVNVK